MASCLKIEANAETFTKVLPTSLLPQQKSGYFLIKHRGVVSRLSYQSLPQVGATLAIAIHGVHDVS
ncbi:MAG TPA: hypothetical protein V6D35_22430 [Candidatus Sericytochromatia bacterium]